MKPEEVPLEWMRKAFDALPRDSSGTSPDWMRHAIAAVYPLIRGIDWVVAGGESGPGARPMHPAWARALRDQCAAAGVPFLFKQFGEWRWGDFGNSGETVWLLDNGRQSLIAPDNPFSADWAPMVRVGKKAAGRMLADRLAQRYQDMVLPPLPLPDPRDRAYRLLPYTRLICAGVWAILLGAPAASVVAFLAGWWMGPPIRRWLQQLIAGLHTHTHTPRSPAMSKFVALRHIPEILPEELAVSGLAPAPYVEQVYDEVSKTQTDVWQLVFSRPDRNGPVLVYKVKIRSQFGYGG